MFTNSACTIFDRDGNRQEFPAVYWQGKQEHRANKDGREPFDSLLLIIPTDTPLNLHLDDTIFRGIVEDLPVPELKKKHEFYVVHAIGDFLFGQNPHYKIIGA